MNPAAILIVAAVAQLAVVLVGIAIDRWLEVAA